MKVQLHTTISSSWNYSKSPSGKETFKGTLDPRPRNLVQKPRWARTSHLLSPSSMRHNSSNYTILSLFWPNTNRDNS